MLKHFFSTELLTFTGFIGMIYFRLINDIAGLIVYGFFTIIFLLISINKK